MDKLNDNLIKKNLARFLHRRHMLKNLQNLSVRQSNLFQKTTIILFWIVARGLGV